MKLEGLEDKKTILVAGAGPVGLTLALLLHQNGKKVQVFDSVSELRPLGVGVNLLPHSVRILWQLDLESQLEEIAVRTSNLHYYNKFGQLIWTEARGLGAGYQFPQYSIHRGYFQQMLLHEVKQRLGPDCVKTSHKLVNWSNTLDGVSARFRVSGGAEIEIEGACLIAADGINSSARRILYPDEGDAIYGGRVLWRGTSFSKPFLDGRTMFMAGHQDCKFVAYPIGKSRDAVQLINWIAELSVPELKPDVQDWNREANPNKFKTKFETWRFDWVDIPALIDDCRHVYEFPLSDRDPLPRWSYGNMTLIGDAAHPMYPIGSNGASQGILDVEKLVSELSRDQPISQAFERYESQRRPATSSIVLANRQNGPEQVMQLAEERAPDGFTDIEFVIPNSELKEIAARYKQTAGFTVEAVNN